jgi:hypothetical protein
MIYKAATASTIQGETNVATLHTGSEGDFPVVKVEIVVATRQVQLASVASHAVFRTDTPKILFGGTRN